LTCTALTSTGIDANASSTALTIDSSGNLLCGTASSSGSAWRGEFYRASGSNYIQAASGSLGNSQAAAVIAHVGTIDSVLGIFKHSGITNPTSYVQLETQDSVSHNFWVDDSDQFRISSTQTHIGTTSGTVVGTQTSDIRIKEVTGTVTYGLNEVLALDPISYHRKDDPSIPKIGFSAQQVRPIIPEAVYDTNVEMEGEEDTMLAMEYVQLIPVLVNAIKELTARIEVLEGA